MGSIELIKRFSRLNKIYKFKMQWSIVFLFTLIFVSPPLNAAPNDSVPSLKKIKNSEILWYETMARVRYICHNAQKFSDSQRALKIAEEALEISLQTYKEYHPNINTSTYTLAALHEATEDEEELQKLYQRMRELHDKGVVSSYEPALTVAKPLIEVYLESGKGGSGLSKEILDDLDRLSYAEQEQLIHPIFDISAAFRDFENYDYSELYINRIFRILNEASDLSDDRFSSYIFQLIQYTYIPGQKYSEAEEICLGYLKRAETNLKKFQDSHYSISNQLAGLYKRLDRQSDLEKLYREILDLYTNNLGQDHEKTIEILKKLAELHYQQKDYGKAEPELDKLISIIEKRDGENSNNLFPHLQKLGKIYLASNKKDEAKKVIERSKNLEDSYYQSRQGFQQSMYVGGNELGSSMWIDANPIKYIPFSEDYIEELNAQYQERIEKGAAVDSDDYIRSLFGKASLLFFQGDGEEAEPLYQEAIEKLKEVYGEDHLMVGEALFDLGQFLLVREKEGSSAAFRKSLAIIEKHKGKDDITLVPILENYAGSLQRENNRLLVDDLNSRAKRLKQIANVVDDEQPSKSMTDMISEILDLQFPKSEGWAMQKALRKIKNAIDANGADSVEVAEALEEMAERNPLDGPSLRTRESIPLLEKSLEIKKSVFGEVSHEVAEVLNTLAENYALRTVRDYEKSEQLFEQALSIREELYRNKPRESLMAYSYLLYRSAGYYNRRENYSKAEENYRKIYEINFINPPDADDENDLISKPYNQRKWPLFDKKMIKDEIYLHEKIAYLSELQGKTAEADNYFKQALELRAKRYPQMRTGKKGGGRPYLWGPSNDNYESIVESRRKALGEEHADYLIALENYCKYLKSVAEDEKAKEIERLIKGSIK